MCLGRFYKKNVNELQGAGLDSIWLALPAAIATVIISTVTNSNQTDIGLHLLLFTMLTGFLRRKFGHASIILVASISIIWEIFEILIGVHKYTPNDWKSDLIVDGFGIIGSYAAGWAHNKFK